MDESNWVTVKINPEINLLARKAIVLAALFGATAVIIGAFAAHSLKSTLSPYALGIVETATKYQMYHALALLGVGLSSMFPGANLRYLKVAMWAFAIGILLFAGSLYTLALSQLKWLGMITPLGGLGMIVGWSLLAWAFYSKSYLQSAAGRKFDE